jgi:hypothetical protein
VRARLVTEQALRVLVCSPRKPMPNLASKSSSESATGHCKQSAITCASRSIFRKRECTPQLAVYPDRKIEDVTNAPDEK